MTEPYTAAFGAVPTPEEPPRLPDPPIRNRPAGGAGEGRQIYPNYEPGPPQYYAPAPYAAPSYSPFAPRGPQANAAVINNIRIGGARPFNHTLHLMLTIGTCGLWAPVWLVAWMLHPKG